MKAPSSVSHLSGPLQALAALEQDPGLQLAKAGVIAWMGSEDLQVLAQTAALIDQGHRAISPPLTMDEVDEFNRAYYRRCLRESPRVGTLAARSRVGTGELPEVPHRPADSETLLARWRDWLAEEYKAGDAAIRECLINATLTHAFGRAEGKHAFAMWSNDDVLRDA
jgi:hypothetical protein